MMANQINQSMPMSPLEMPSHLEQVLSDQAEMVRQLDLALRRLQDKASFVMLPEMAVPVVGGTQLNPIAPVASPAVDKVRSTTAHMREIADAMDAMAQRF